MKKILFFILIMTMAALKVNAIDLPRDPANIELTIAFHKDMIKALDMRIMQTELMREEQTANTSKTAKFDRLMDTLHVRERGVMNWLYFADNLNTIRGKFVKIYKLENEILDMVRDWGLSAPDVDFRTLKGIKGTYRDFGAKVAVLMLGYDSQMQFIRKTKALAQLFAIQFGGSVTDNTFSGKMKNLTINLGTDYQRREFTNRVMWMQNDIIYSLEKTMELMKYTIIGYYKFDFIGAALDFLESASYYRTKEFNVEQTFKNNVIN